MAHEWAPRPDDTNVVGTPKASVIGFTASAGLSV
jgi:hypothetical protein